MLQTLMKKGKVYPENVPAPLVSNGSIFIKVVNSCISTGTELIGISESRKPLIRKSLEQPENVRKVLNMVRSEGIAKTYETVRGLTEYGTPTGYSVAGIVLAVGKGVKNIHLGDRVAAAGAGIANHAEYVDVPRNLVMRIPDGVNFKQASTVTLGGIAMQAVRRAEPALGEFVVVFGTGILGLLCIQLLKSAGARVLAVDIDRKRLKLATKMGAEAVFNSNEGDCSKIVYHHTGGHGADIVLFCASTRNYQALSDAFTMTRKKGRVVMVGVWGSKFNREDIYKKELDFMISTSYGPGRYDESYEKKGLDYPYAYVRWTENRNMEEYLRLIETKAVDVDLLIGSTFPIEECEKAFRTLEKPDRPLMVLLDYGSDLPADFLQIVNAHRMITSKIYSSGKVKGRINVGVIGAGSFATTMHLPYIKKLASMFQLRAVCSKTGSKAVAAAQQFKAGYSTTDYREILRDPEIDFVMICTRHHLHGQMILDALKAGKHTFVEKPVCTRPADLEKLGIFFQKNKHPPFFTVGYNRRYSRFIQKIKQIIKTRTNPVSIIYRMNAGFLPKDHWVNSNEGGGRLIGEVCHIIDLLPYIIGSKIRSYSLARVRPRTSSLCPDDNVLIAMEFEDGSIAALSYFAMGSQDLSKEYMEVHFDEKSIILDNYQSIKYYGFKGTKIKHRTPDKGHFDMLKSVGQILTEEENSLPIPLDSLFKTSEICFALNDNAFPRG